MAFMSFEPFLYARNDLRFLCVEDLSVKKSGKYYIYELCGENSHSNLIKNSTLKTSENSQISSENEQNLDKISHSNEPNLDKNSQILDKNEPKNSRPKSQNNEVCKEKFSYTALNDGLFGRHDELVITILKRKIILFRNFTRNLDNFKEAKLRHIVFSLLFFCASSVFGAFCVKNGFQSVDIAFFMLFFLGFIMACINYALLKKQIAILSTLEKQDFIDYTHFR